MRPMAIASYVLGIAAAFAAGTGFGAGTAKSKVTNLLQTSLSEEFTPGREILVDLVEIPPNTALDRHWHAGEEFHYYLEGDPEVQVKGEEVTHPKRGTVGHIPFKAVHRASAGKHGAKVLVFRVHTKGEPWRYLENNGPEGRDATRQ